LMVVVFYGTPRFTLVVVPELLLFAAVAAVSGVAAVSRAAALPAFAAGGRAARALRQAGKAALVAVAFLALAEAGLRFFGYGRYVIYRPDPELLWVPLPHQAGRTEVGRRPITINGDGLRYPVDLPPRDPGEMRVFTFGDSVTMGWGMDDASHYSAVLERLLAAGLRPARAPAGPPRRVRVVSAGVNAYPTALCVRRFRRLLDSGQQIDVAVLAYSFNHAHEGLARLRGAERDAFLRKVAWKSRVRRSALYNFLVEDLLREAVYYRIRDRLVAGSWDMEAAGQRAEIPGYLAHLEEMRALAEARGVRLVFLLLGSQDQREDLDDFQVAMRAFARRHGIPLCDMVRRLAPLDQRGLFVDQAHPSAAGHRLIAEELRAVLAGGQRRGA
jgi:lysophospholipase L1-like esterase